MANLTTRLPAALSPPKREPAPPLVAPGAQDAEPSPASSAEEDVGNSNNKKENDVADAPTLLESARARVAGLGLDSEYDATEHSHESWNFYAGWGEPSPSTKH